MEEEPRQLQFLKTAQVTTVWTSCIFITCDSLKMQNPRPQPRFTESESAL